MGGTLKSQNLRSLKKLKAPLGGEVELLELDYDGGAKLLRVRIRQGSRFTDLDLDPDTAKIWASTMAGWASLSL